MARPNPARLLGGAAAAGAALAAYALLVEPRWLQLTRPVVQVPGLRPGLEGLRIALLTDLHPGAGTPAWLIRRACRWAMAERPHLVALTGDLAGREGPSPGRVLELLAELRAPLGVYAVPGNHDHAAGIAAWHREVTGEPGIVDLTNRFEVRRFRGARLCVAGVDDLTRGRPRLVLPRREARDFTLLLAHNPAQAEQARDGVDLVLSGHTHGGQLRLPLVGPLARPGDGAGGYDQGLTRRPWTQVYTSRGVGTVHLPARFLCRPEVAVIRLTSGRGARSAP